MAASASDPLAAVKAPATDAAGWPAGPANGATAALLQELKAWSEQGWIRRLDSVFASFMVDLAPDTVPAVVMAAALVTYLEGRGHSCLLIDDLLNDPDELLGWAPAASGRMRLVLGSLPPQPDAWLDALRASRLVWAEAPAGQPAQIDLNQPLVLCGSKLYLRRYWHCERQVAAQVLQRGTAVETVNEAEVRRWLDRLFVPTDRAAGAPAIDWQKVACGVALRGRLSVITGGPGTGKTYTAARLLALLFAVDPAPDRLRVALAAPTGKAAARLKQAIETALQELGSKLEGHPKLLDLGSHIGPARTLHSLLGARPDTRRFKADSAHPLEIDVLIVDEASMVHLEMMHALLEAMPTRARIILLGDKDQLASVEAGAVLGDLCRDAERGLYDAGTVRFVESVTGQRLPPAYTGAGPALAQQTVMLRESWRFGGPIGQLALAVNAGNAIEAARLLRGHPGQSLDWVEAREPADIVALAVNGRTGAQGGYRGYLELLKRRPAAADRQVFMAWTHSVLTAFEGFRLLCAVREGNWGTVAMNLAVERALIAEALLVRRGEWYEGRPVMVTRNDPGIGVFNGDIGIVMKPLDAGAPLRAYFLDGAALRSVGVSRLANVDTAFAMTVHKSQGSEFEHTALVLPQEPSRVLTRELVYTGITRARKSFTLVTGRAQALADALRLQTRRSSGLIDRLKDC